jgi:hypothetical protein
VQAYLAALADGDSTPPMSSEPPNIAAFVAGLSGAWHMGEIRPTFPADAKPRYLRGLERVPPPERIATAPAALPVPPPIVTATQRTNKRQPVYAEPGQGPGGRREAVQRLVNELTNNILDEAVGNKNWVRQHEARVGDSQGIWSTWSVS